MDKKIPERLSSWHLLGMLIKLARVLGPGKDWCNLHGEGVDNW